MVAALNLLGSAKLPTPGQCFVGGPCDSEIEAGMFADSFDDRGVTESHQRAAVVAGEMATGYVVDGFALVHAGVEAEVAVVEKAVDGQRDAPAPAHLSGVGLSYERRPDGIAVGPEGGLGCFANWRCICFGTDAPLSPYRVYAYPSFSSLPA